MKLVSQYRLQFGSTGIETPLEVFPLAFENPEEDGNGTTNKSD
jgi:hypothetical protein